MNPPQISYTSSHYFAPLLALLCALVEPRASGHMDLGRHRVCLHRRHRHIVQLVALFRSLDLRDEDESHYRLTVRYFFGGIVVVLIGVFIVTLVE